MADKDHLFRSSSTSGQLSSHHASIVDGVFQSCTIEQVKKMHDDMQKRLESTEEHMVDMFMKNMDGWMQFVHDMETIQQELHECISLCKQRDPSFLSEEP